MARKKTYRRRAALRAHPYSRPPDSDKSNVSESSSINCQPNPPVRQSLRIQAQSEANDTTESDVSHDNNDDTTTCPFSNIGCKWTGSRNGIGQHMNHCLFKNVQPSHDNTHTTTAPDCNSESFTVPSSVINANHMFALHQQWLSSTNPQHYHEFRTALTTRNHIPLADESSHSGDSEDSLDFNNNDLVELDDNDVDDIHTQYPPAHEMVVDPAFNVEEILQEGDFGVDLNEGLVSRHSLLTYDEYTLFQSHLLSEIMQYRKVPLCLFDTIMNTIKYHALERNLDFNQKDIFTSRKSLLNRLKKIHGMENFKATVVDVPISLNRMAGCILFDFHQIAQYFFSNPRLFRPENIAEGYNVLTGESEPSDVYGECHTGKLFAMALDEHIGDSGLMPVALNLFSDETNTDGKGGLNATLVTVQYANFNEETRMKHGSSFPIGIIPSLKTGVSKDENLTSAQKCQDEHDCLHAILKQLIDIKKNGGMDITVYGSKRKAMPFIHLVIGDIKGHDTLGACFADNQGKTQLPNRMCYCKDYFNPEVRCEFFRLQDFLDAKEEWRSVVSQPRSVTRAANIMRKVSRHPILTVWERGVPLSSILHGIYIAFPPEVLHTFGVGLCARVINVIHDSLNTEDVLLIDRLHATIYRDLQRNCDHDIPESSLIKGAAETVKQGAVENIGNLLNIMCIAVTETGKDLMTRYLYTGDDKDVVTPLIALFSYIGWLHSTNPKNEVEHALPAVYDMLRDIKTFFDREKGNNWDIPKFHGAIQICECIPYHGSARNQYGGPGEESHKTWLKDPSIRTRRQAKSFLPEVGKRIEENVVLEAAMETMQTQMVDDIDSFPLSSIIKRRKNEVDTDYLMSQMSRMTLTSKTLLATNPTGKYKVHLTHNSNNGNGYQVTVDWHSNKKTKRDQQIGICVELQSFLSSHLNGSNQSITAIGYTCISVMFPSLGQKSIIRCSELFLERNWYDFVAVRMGSMVLAAKVCGILVIDNEIRIVIHPMKVNNAPRRRQHTNVVDFTSTTSDILKETQEKFVVKFTLDTTSTITSVTIDMLVEPLIVFHNYGGSRSEYISLLPKRKWGKWFSHEIRNRVDWPF